MVLQDSFYFLLFLCDEELFVYIRIFLPEGLSDVIVRPSGPPETSRPTKSRVTHSDTFTGGCSVEKVGGEVPSLTFWLS